MTAPTDIPTPSADHVTLRRIVYGLLIVTSVAGMVGRIAAVQSRSGKTPMLSANDRSRWANIRSLVDHGTYEIDRVIFPSAGKRDPEWYSIDMVKHRGRDGREHFYSSKPTLLTTLMAGPYWVWKQLTGGTLATHPFNAIRGLLVLFNIVPLIVYFVIFAWIIERMGSTDFGRIFAMFVATFGTYLTTFAVTANNHLPAAVCVLATIGVAIQIGWLGKRTAGWFALAGFLSAMTAANELPALSFFCIAAAGFLCLAPRMTLVAFTPAAAVVLAGAIGTNYLAHGTWSTPYAHRKDGPRIATLSSQSTLASGKLSDSLRKQLVDAGIGVSADATLAERPAGKKGWTLWDPQSEQRWAVSEEDGKLHVHTWDNWYEYEGSYWSSGKKQGVDVGEPSQLVYAFHALIGHHGVLSLSPLWLASIVGAGLWLRRGITSQQVLALVTVILTIVSLIFYILLRPVEDRNYGGVSCCFRWTVWLIPFWLLCLLPAADAVADRRWLRNLLMVLLFISVFSASYNSMNPWSHPWLFDYWSHLRWIKY